MSVDWRDRRGHFVHPRSPRHAVVGQGSEPQVRTGAQCSNPYECCFRAYCQSQEPQLEYPIKWLPRLTANAVNDFIETNAIKDLRDVPDEYLDDLQRRVKAQTLSGKPFFDHAGAAAELAQHNLPACFLDFETIQFAVPIWKGTRPYQQIRVPVAGKKLLRSSMEIEVQVALIERIGSLTL